MAPSAGHPAPAPSHPDILSLALCLAGALLLSPLLLAARLDWDRAQPLLLVPALLVAWRMGRTGSPPANRIEAWALTAAALALGVSTAFAAHGARAAATGSAWILIIAGGVVARRLAGQAAAVRVVLLGMALSALLGLVVVRLYVSPAMGIPLYEHPRLLGLHLLTGSIAAIGLFLTRPSRRRAPAISGFALAAIVTGGMWWSGGRAPLVGLAAGLAIWFWIASSDTRKQMLRWLPPLLACACAIAISLGKPDHDVGWDFAFGRTVEAQSFDALSSNRADIWDTVFSHIRTSPWIGHGADSYLFILPKLNGAQPHDFLMQWVLDFGLLGAIPLVALLALRLRVGFGKSTAADSISQIPMAGLAACIVAGFFDGMLYHAILFMPTALFAGMAGSPKTSDARVPNWMPQAGRLVTVAATLVLLLNGWLFLQLHEPPPPSPHALRAKILRLFPSNVRGLWTWLDAWKTRDPDTALEWAHWAGRHAISPELFGIYAARLQLERKHYRESEQELQRILTYIDTSRQRPIHGMINEVRRQAATSQAQPGHPAQ